MASQLARTPLPPCPQLALVLWSVYFRSPNYEKSYKNKLLQIELFCGQTVAMTLINLYILAFMESNVDLLVVTLFIFEQLNH